MRYHPTTDLAANQWSARLLGVQGTYYLLTGIWPLISIRTFQAITGPKTDHLPTGREPDHWLVFTVGVLVTAIAAAVLVAAYRRRLSPEICVLSLTAAAGLTAIDITFVVRGVISPVYLVDAVIQILLILGFSAIWVGLLGVRHWAEL